MTPHSATITTVLDAYFGKRVGRRALQTACRSLVGDDAQGDYSHLQAAVGTLVLGGTNRRIEQWSLTGDGLVRGSRRVRGKRVGGVPLPLFTVEFPDHNASYFATALAERSRRVVTVSFSTIEMFGYFDIALGDLPSEQELVDGLRPLIAAHWELLASYGVACPTITGVGPLPRETVTQWADSAWADAEE